MFSALREWLARLSSVGPAQEPAGEPIVYKGFRIRAAPYPSKGQYQTAGVIERDVEGSVREHRFVRAETHPNQADAAAFAIVKGKQIIDEQGDRLFG